MNFAGINAFSGRKDDAYTVIDHVTTLFTFDTNASGSDDTLMFFSISTSAYGYSNNLRWSFTSIPSSKNAKVIELLKLLS